METGGVRFVSARREGNSLIMTMDVVSGPTTGAEAAAQFVMGLCLAPDMQAAFFDQGWTLRLETTVRGRDRLEGRPITSCPAPPHGVDPLVAQLATNMRGAMGRMAASPMPITGTRGEGRTLILDIALPATTVEVIGPPQVASVYAAAICAEPGGGLFFRDGRVLRVDVVRTGRAIGSATVDRCPGPSGEGFSAGTFASSLQSFVGMEDGGVRFVSVRAEGNSLIVTQDVVSGPTGAAAATANFVASFCGGSNIQTIFFDRGLTLRVDTTVRGRDLLTGTPITACPAR
jgi:hypothetical protein